MLLAIEFPFADARKFLPTIPLLPSPGWPAPTPDAEFVRALGTIRRRWGGGVNDGWSTEAQFCDAHRAIRFNFNPNFHLRSAGLQVKATKHYRKFYFDGDAGGKFEVGICTTKRGSFMLTKPQAAALVTQFLHFPVHVPSPAGARVSCELAQAGHPLTTLYAAASVTATPPTPQANWWLRGGSALLFLQQGIVDQIPNPFYARSVMLPKTYPFTLHYCLVPYSTTGGHLPMWWLGLDLDAAGPADYQNARILRLYLMRLHAEYEALQMILRYIGNRQIVVAPGTPASENLQYYLETVLQRITDIETAISASFGKHLVEVGHQSLNTISNTQQHLIMHQLEKLNPSQKMLRNLETMLGKLTSIGRLEITMGDTTNGSYSPIIKNSHVHEGVSNSTVYTAPDPDSRAIEELKHLVQQFQSELQSIAEQGRRDKQEEIETASIRAADIVEEIEKPKLDTEKINFSLDSLKKAATNIAAVMPSVLEIATQIVAHVQKLI